MPQKSQVTEDMVKPIVKNLLHNPTLLKDAISESGIEIVPKQSTPTHNKEITGESVTCSLVKNESRISQVNVHGHAGLFMYDNKL